MALLQRTANMNSASGINIALLRLAHIHDRMAPLFRSEASTVFHRVNFRSFSTGYSNARFGQATSSLQPLSALLERNHLLESDGPRSMQAALKLTFQEN